MPTGKHRKSIDERAGKDPQIALLLSLMAVRGWSVEHLAEACEMKPRSMREQFKNDFSSKTARIRVNEAFKPRQVFFEGIGKKGLN